MTAEFQLVPLMDSRSRTWRKVLYEDQHVSDNHVPGSFLSELTINKHLKLYNYWELVFSSVVLTQQLCIVCVFILSWWYMGDGLIMPETIFAIAIFLCIIGYILYLKLNHFSFGQDRILNDIKTAILLIGFTAFFSPVLVTLTHTISTDTIYTMTTVMLLGHLVFQDYAVNAIFASRAVSLNMSVFAAVCLASRLDAVFPTFVTIFLAFLLFGLWAPLRRSLWKNKPVLLHCIAIFMYFIVCIGFLLVDVFSCVAFAVVVSSVIFLFPWLLISMQDKKHNIRGPWDEAVIEDFE